MLITKFSVSSVDTESIGLKEICMNRLGKFVSLTGKNGAGKSRVLDILQNSIAYRMQNNVNVEQWLLQIKSFEDVIQQNPNHSGIPSWELQIKGLKAQVDQYSNITTNPANVYIQFARFVPKNNQLRDPRNDTKAGVSSYYQQAKAIGLIGFQDKCFPYIQALQDRYYEATHPESTLSEDEKIKIKDEYLSFRKLINEILKTDLKRSADSNALIFGKPLAESALSDGQKILLQFLTGLHAQKESLNDCVFIMDEPENHLHPSALIQFIEALSSYAQNSQFWIATHSIPLLAYVAKKEPMSIWYVEDGTVTNAGHYPQKVLAGLIGDEEQIAALHSFTGLPAQYAATTFAVESLLPPKVSEPSKGDPQNRQITKMLNLENSTSNINILDFGAGKGRLLSGLRESVLQHGKDIRGWINYYAYDTCQLEGEACKSLINEVYDDGANRWFKSVDEFFRSQDEASLDVVVMCNVLHEIPPNEWLKIFDKNSIIYRALKENGHLLVVEDQRLPVGEKAHQFGFLVLDTQHLRSLFMIKKVDMDNQLFQSDDSRGDGRLKAHLISKALIGRICAESRKKALEELRETAKCEISRLRGETASDYKNGQLHGFWTQQFANASLYLDEI